MNRKFTPLAQIDGMSEYQAGTRTKVQRELQRRYGFAATNIPGAGAPILSIVSANVATGGAAVVTQTPGAGGTINVLGSKGAAPLWRDLFLLIPGGDSCAMFPSQERSGTVSGVENITQPAPDGCAGTITLTAVEGGSGQQQLTPYGYQFVIQTYDSAGVLTNTYTSACLVNQGVSYIMPPDTLNITCTVTGGCSGGATPGNWTCLVTIP